MKYILVTGGVISGIGKGIVTSSIGALLKACNLTVTAIKIDPYLNMDAGTFSPYEHGEVYVLNDGCEADLDLGNYERFLDVNLCRDNNITTGKIYQLVIQRERQGDYLGKTVQIIPHITDAIKEWIEDTANKSGADVCIIELGGTIGDIEGMPFVEALRQLRKKVKVDNFCCCHVNPVLLCGPSDEFKSKPTQVSVRQLRELGLQPDMIVCRCKIPINDTIRDKISFFCDFEENRVMSLPDLKSVYMVPIFLEQQGMVKSISECLKLKLEPSDTRLASWSEISNIAVNASKEIVIALVGKYVSSQDCYTSVIKSLEHACYDQGAKPLIRYIDSDLLLEGADNKAWKDLMTSHCLLVPGGFGIRGVEGKVQAIRWARLNKMPFLGICLGFQMAVVEYARDLLSIKNAHSSEFEPEVEGPIEPLVIEMLEYLDPERKMGGTMRLGLRETKFVVDKCISKSLYGDKDIIEERHRHRYEINPIYIDKLEEAGMKFVGKSADETRMEILELAPSEHPYFVAVQYHPEFLSRPFRPSPVFKGLIVAAKDFRKL